MLRTVAGMVMIMAGLALMAFEVSSGAIGRDGDVGTDWAVLGLGPGVGISVAGLILLFVRKRR